MVAVVAIQADVTDVKATERAVAEAAEKVGHAQYRVCERWYRWRQRPWARHLMPLSTRSSETNLTGVFLHRASRGDASQRGARRSFSMAPFTPSWGRAGIFGLRSHQGWRAVQWTRNLASEFAPRGIRVNQVYAGWQASQNAPSGRHLHLPDEAMVAPRTPDRGGLFRSGRIWRSRRGSLKPFCTWASDDASKRYREPKIVVDGGATGAPQGAPAYRTE